MGNTNVSKGSPAQRFQSHEKKKRLLINGFCGSILSEIYPHKQFNVDIITDTVMRHFDYTINSLMREIIYKLQQSEKIDKKNQNYYLLISLEISKMLIESHGLIRKQFKTIPQKRCLNSETASDKYLNKLRINISVINIVCKSHNSIGKSLPLCPSKTVDNYSFAILCDPTGIYNGKYNKCLSLTDFSIHNGGTVSYLKPTCKNYNKSDFLKSYSNIWVHNKDMIYNKDKHIWLPNLQLKYIRCLTREEWDYTNCFWRLSCLKLNENGKLLHLQWIGENRLNAQSNHCIQYLGVVPNLIYNNRELLSDEYPCSKHTTWRKITGVNTLSSLSTRLGLFRNDWCVPLPQLNNLGQSSNEIHCKLMKYDSKIYFNSKFVKSIEKNINYNNNPIENESKLIYYYVIIWLNELIYKCALDNGFAPYVDYKEKCNPFGRQLQKYIFDGRRIKYYGKDIYFKFDYAENGKNNIKIADEEWVSGIVYKLLNCLRRKLQNKNDTTWYNCLNNIQFTPQYKLNKVRLNKK